MDNDEQTKNILDFSDSLLHPDIENKVFEFMENDGSEYQLKKTLVDNYKGTLHKIDLLCHVFKDSKYDIASKYDNFIVNICSKKFKPEVFEKALEKDPDLVEKVISTQCGCDIIVDLSGKYLSSRFVNMCMDRVCLEHPQRVKYLTRQYSKFNHFDPLIRYKIEHSSCKSADLASFLATDARSILEAAMMLDRNTNVNMFKLIEKEILRYKDSLYWFFLRILMKFDGWSETCMGAFMGEVKLNKSIISQFHSLCEKSRISKELIYRKLISILLNPKFDDSISESVISILCGDHIDSSDVPKYVLGISYVKEWKYDEREKLPYTLYALKNYIFAKCILKFVKGKIESSNFLKSDYYPEMNILLEIAYLHPSLRNKVFDIYVLLMNNCSTKPYIDTIYDNLIDWIYFGMHKSVFAALKSKDSKTDHFTKRKFLKYFVQQINTKSLSTESEFVIDLLNLLNSKSIREIIFTQDYKTLSVKELLITLKYFLEELNKNNRDIKCGSIITEIHREILRRL